MSNKKGGFSGPADKSSSETSTGWFSDKALEDPLGLAGSNSLHPGKSFLAVSPMRVPTPSLIKGQAGIEANEMRRRFHE